MHQLRSVISYPPVALQQRADTIRTMQNLISISALRFVVLYEQNSLYTLEDIFMVDNFMVDNFVVAKIWGFSRKIPKF